MPETEPQPLRVSSANVAESSSFKPVALPALAAALKAHKALEKPTIVKKPLADDLDRFGRSFT